jgi:polyferredoxin
VQVCPTGIDIRQGLQYECIGCGLCVDACDTVMDRMQKPRGLIRYATENGMAQGWTGAQVFRRVFRPRVLVYGCVLLALCTGLLASLVVRVPLKVDVVRDRGSLARIVEGGRLENVYRLQIMNATERPSAIASRPAGWKDWAWPRTTVSTPLRLPPPSPVGSRCACKCRPRRPLRGRTLCTST